MVVRIFLSPLSLDPAVASAYKTLFESFSSKTIEETKARIAGFFAVPEGATA